MVSIPPDISRRALAATHALDGEAATARLGRAMAGVLEAGEAVLLDGPLGAGKSTLCRALIRAWAGDAALEVPSPTYTLVQVYQGPRGVLRHYDLWRLTGPGDLEELGFFDDGAIRLVEWAERLGGAAPPAWRVDLSFSSTGRRAIVRAP